MALSGQLAWQESVDVSVRQTASLMNRVRSYGRTSKYQSNGYRLVSRSCSRGFLSDFISGKAVLRLPHLRAHCRGCEDYGLVGCDAMFHLQISRPFYSEDVHTISLRNIDT